jgi:RNA polymerase sigma-70 factor (ECF subfamily)
MLVGLLQGPALGPKTQEARPSESLAEAARDLDAVDEHHALSMRSALTELSTLRLSECLILFTMQRKLLSKSFFASTLLSTRTIVKQEATSLGISGISPSPKLAQACDSLFDVLDWLPLRLVRRDSIMDNGQTTQYQNWIDRLRADDDSALDEMLAHFESRLMHLSHLMLQRFPQVRRWEQTGDVFQEAILRLQKALRCVIPETQQDFLNLAALQMRRELLTLSQAYKKHARPSEALVGSGDSLELGQEPSSATDGPCELASWTEFHEKAEVMDAPLRQVFDLVWYNGLSQSEAAQVLKVSERTVRARWQGARQAMHAALGGQLPGR